MWKAILSCPPDISKHTFCVLDVSCNTSPVVCGGDFAWRTLQVLLEAQVKGLSDGADDVLGQTIRALQYVTRWWGPKQHIAMSMLHVGHSMGHDIKKNTPTSSINRVLCYIGNVISGVLKTNGNFKLSHLAEIVREYS